MSHLFTSSTLTDPSAARRAATHSHQARRWLDRATFSVLAAVVVIACFVLPRTAPVRSLLGTRASRILRVDDRGLRQRAINAPPPVYPSTSLASKITGVVVAAVTIDVHGKLRSVKIVESPDAAIGLAARDALLQWVFRPVGVPIPADLITGNIIFYFHIQSTRGVVSSPEELQAIRGINTPPARVNTQPIVRVIDETEFRRLRDTLAPVVLDTRSRAAHLQGHREGSVSIPLGELSTRAGAELPLSGLIVIDCFAEQQHSGLCEMAVHILTSRGFSNVAVLSRSSE